MKLTIEIVTIASKGNATSFGDLTEWKKPMLAGVQIMFEVFLLEDIILHCYKDIDFITIAS